jgi:hypothetical protein
MYSLLFTVLPQGLCDIIEQCARLSHTGIRLLRYASRLVAYSSAMQSEHIRR